MKIRKNLVFYTFLILFIVLIMLFLNIPNKKMLEDEIYSYALTNKSLNMSDITDFKWDTAYLDYETYGNGSKLKSKYSLNGNFQTLESDFLYRIAFYEHNKLVYDCILNETHIIFDSSIEKFDTKTKFVVSKTKNSYGIEVVYLLITSPDQSGKNSEF